MGFRVGCSNKSWHNQLFITASTIRGDGGKKPAKCGCQSVAFMTSASVAPFARFIMAITSAFLLVRSGLCAPADFLAGLALFVGLAFLAARVRFGAGASAAGVPLDLRPIGGA